MSVESATYITQLSVANPAAGDPRSQGDDHLRLIKTVLQSTFPSLDRDLMTELRSLYAVSATDPKYGAVGDGVADDTAAIQAAGDAASTVRLPAGTYLASNLSWTTDVALILDDGAIIKHKSSSTDHMIESTAELRISGGILDGNKAGQTGRYDVVHCSGDKFVVSDLILQNSVSAGIAADGVSDLIQIQSVYFVGMGEHSGTVNETSKCIDIQNASDRVDISHNWFIGGTPSSDEVAPGGIFISGTSISLRIIGNYFEKIGQNETSVGNFIGNIDLYTDADDTIVANNYFTDAYYQPLKLQNARNLVVSGNNIVGYLGQATAMINWAMTRSFNENLTVCSITGNNVNISSNTACPCLTIQHEGSGTYLAGKLVVNGNVFLGGDLGINLKNIADINIIGNVISGQNTGGILGAVLSDAGATINITGNQFENIGTRHISLLNVNDTDNMNINITGNTFDATSGTPSHIIDIRGDSGGFIEKVNISGNLIKGTGSTADIYVERIDALVMSGNIADGTITSNNNTVEIVQGNSWQTLETYTPTNVVTDRAYDANSTTTAEIADVLGTLIADLQSSGILK